MEEQEEEQTVVLRARSFNAAERMECQQEFGHHFGDLLKVITEAVNPGRTGLMTRKIVDDSGRQRFPDEILQFMFWVQAKRDRPDAQLSDFDGMLYYELSKPWLTELLGNAEPSSERSKT